MKEALDKLREMWEKLRRDSGLLLVIALATGACLLLPQGGIDTAGVVST